MNTTLKRIETTFSILHDGVISAWSGDKNLLLLTVDCTYLAERIDKSFNLFYVYLIGVDKIVFDAWTQSDAGTTLKTELPDIFRDELEINSADVQGESVVVTCLQHDKALDYSGGDLIISCQDIKVFDEEKHELTLEQFEKLAHDYWSDWSRK